MFLSCVSEFEKSSFHALIYIHVIVHILFLPKISVIAPVCIYLRLFPFKYLSIGYTLLFISQAVQLIKAVAVLLNFSNQEQQLIKQNLEWKMSWFGSRPSMGKGQMAKMVPPSY